jgi:hypothetical protein
MRAALFCLTGIAPDIVTEVGFVSGQVADVVAQIAPDGIDIMLFVTTASIPVPGRTPIAVLNGTPFASRVIVALRSLLSQVSLVVVEVYSIAPDVALVAINVALGKYR